MKSLQSQAKLGNAAACTTLGCLYQLGQGVPRNHAEAVERFRQAAGQGHAVALHNLGFMAQHGLGTPRCSGEAAECYRWSAAQGNARGQYRLGRLYEEGLAVPEDAGQAMVWYRLAAEQGDAEAQYRLGRLLKEIRDSPSSQAESLQWCRQAAQNGLVEAWYEMGCRHVSGDGVDHSLDEAEACFRQVLEAADAGFDLELGLQYQDRIEGQFTRRLCRHYAQRRLLVLNRCTRRRSRDMAEALLRIRLKARKRGSEARFRLGMAALHGQGRPRDLEMAVRWLRKAAERGLPRAQFALGWICESGWQPGGEADADPRLRLAHAAEWYALAAEGRCPEAQLRLGILCREGAAPRMSRDEAEKWFDLVRHGVDPFAKVQLELLLESGWGAQTDPAVFADRLNPDATDPDPARIVCRGLLYRQGLIVPEDLPAAAGCFRRAAALQDVRGQFLMGVMREMGEGVPQNFRDACRWYQRAAGRGYEPAQACLLALCHRWGFGRVAEPEDPECQGELSTFLPEFLEWDEERGRTPESPHPACAGCGKNSAEVRRMIRYGNDWHLCNDCIDVSHGIVHEDGDFRDSTSDFSEHRGTPARGIRPGLRRD